MSKDNCHLSSYAAAAAAAPSGEGENSFVWSNNLLGKGGYWAATVLLLPLPLPERIKARRRRERGIFGCFGSSQGRRREIRLFLSEDPHDIKGLKR